MILIPLYKYPEVGLWDHMVIFKTFLGDSPYCSVVATQLYNLNSVLEVPFLHILANTCCLLVY